MKAHVDKLPTDSEIEIATTMLKLVSQPTRLKILWALLHGEHSVTALAKHVGASQTTVSQHLGKLRTAQLVKIRRDGNTLYYSTDNEHVREVIKQALSHAEHKAEGV